LLFYTTFYVTTTVPYRTRLLPTFRLFEPFACRLPFYTPRCLPTVLPLFHCCSGALHLPTDAGVMQYVPPTYTRAIPARTHGFCSGDFGTYFYDFLPLFVLWNFFYTAPHHLTFVLYRFLPLRISLRLFVFVSDSRLRCSPFWISFTTPILLLHFVVLHVFCDSLFVTHLRYWNCVSCTTPAFLHSRHSTVSALFYLPPPFHSTPSTPFYG